MAKYVDGFVIVVPGNRAEEYKKMAQDGRDLWMKCGALDYYECIGDDLKAMEMGDQKTRSFPEMTGATDSDTVWFSFIVFNSKQHRDEVNAKVMEEMNKQMELEGPQTMSNPFDMKQMAYGGFQVVVEA